MSLTKEWFEARDQFIEKQTKQGNLSLKQAIDELGVKEGYLFDMAILTSRDLTTASTNFTQLTPLGGLFFIEQYQQIFISQTKLEKLKQALHDWDNFTVELEDSNTNIVGQLSVRNQKHVKFEINGRLFQHRFRFKIDDSRNEMAIFLDSEDSKQLLTLWEDFCECVLLIENEEKSPTNAEIATDTDAIENLCAPWHRLVQRYFRSKMHQIGFEHNLLKLKKEIEQSYCTPNTEWFPVPQYFTHVRPLRTQGDETSLIDDEQDETNIDLVTLKSIDECGVIQVDRIENSTRKLRSLRECCQLQPGDILLYKDRECTKIHVAYYSSDNEQSYYTSSMFCLLRSKNGDSHWNGKRLFLFFQTQAGKQLIEYTFRDFSVNEMASPRLSPRQVNLLEVPQLSKVQATKLDKRFTDLLAMTNQIKELNKQIILTLSSDL